MTKANQVNNLTFLQYSGIDFNTAWGSFVSDLAANYSNQYLVSWNITSYFDGALFNVYIGAVVSNTIV